MSETGRVKPPVIRPGSLKSKFVLPGAITGVRVTEDGIYRVVETGEPDFRRTEDQ